MKERLGGLLLVLIGLGMGYFAVWRPWHEAAVHAPSVSVSMKGVLLVPAILLLGLGMLVGGRPFASWLRLPPAEGEPRGKITVAGWVFFAVCMAGGVALYAGLQHLLATLGYGN